MKHRIKKKILSRDTQHRQALLRNLLRALFTHGSITTTEAKAKELKRHADKLISRARQDTLSAKRQLHRFFGKRDAVNTLTQKIAPLFAKRTSGFTSLRRIGKRRGDNASLVVLSLVKQPAEVGDLKKPASKTDKTTKVVKPKLSKTAKSSKSAKVNKATKTSKPKSVAKKTKPATTKTKTKTSKKKS